MKIPRMFDWLVVTLAMLLAIWLIAPQQLPVTLYKLFLTAAAGWVGYRVDRSLFPYARPHVFRKNALLEDSIVFAAAQIRRAIIVGAAMLAVSQGA